VLYRHAGGNRDGSFTDWFAFTVTSGARAYLTPVSGVFWVVVELTDRELPALDANIPLTVTHGDLATITAINLHISQTGVLFGLRDLDRKLIIDLYYNDRPIREYHKTDDICLYFLCGTNLLSS